MLFSVCVYTAPSDGIHNLISETTTVLIDADYKELQSISVYIQAY